MALRPSQVRRIPGQAPIIPEIAQAYQNDPRTQVARASVNAGISGAPVAEGEYAWADAAARAMNGALGGYQDRRMRGQYGAQDDATVAERAQAAQAALAEQSPAGPTQAIAKALGAPPPTMPPAAPAAGVAGLPPTMPPAAPPPPTMPPPPRQPRPAQGVAFTDPLAGTGRVTSAYGAARPNGRTHNGRDLAAGIGTPVGAAAEGTVIRAWNDTANGGGNSVRIRHADGSITGYAHMASLNVRTGDPVRAGQPIGGVGSTGRSSGPHLHFTYRDPNGRRVDPATLSFGAPQQGAPEEGAPEEAAALADVEVQGFKDYGMPAEEMPTAPQAVGATRSRGLRAGYELAASGNPYESARAQGLITAGLDNQTQLDENDANRRNDTNMIGYRAGLDRYSGDRTQIRSQRYGTSERLGSQQYGTSERVAGQQYGTSERVAGQQYGTSERVAGQNFAETQAERDRAAQRSNLELQVGSREEVARTRAMSTPSALRVQTAANDAVQANASTIARIDEFLSINAEHGTGGVRQRLPFGADTFGDQRGQRMEALGNQLAIDLSSQLKGALSDRDMETIRNGGLNITRTRRANAENGAFMRRAVERANEYQVARVEALARSDPGFTREWAAYTSSVPLADGAMSYDDWKASIPAYDAQGNRIP